MLHIFLGRGIRYATTLEKLALPNVGEVVAAVKAVTYRG